MSYASSRVVIEFGSDSDFTTRIVSLEEYSFESDFLIPCDAFYVRYGDKQITELTRKFVLKGGQKIKLYVEFLDQNGSVLFENPIFTGFLDRVDESYDRGGTYFNLHGRNILGPLCDSGINPWSNTYKFVEGQTLGDVMGKVFATFGITDFYLTDVKNRQITTGVDKHHATLQQREITTTTLSNILSDTGATHTTTSTVITEWVDPTNTFDLAEKNIQKLQPRHDETFMQFVENNLSRFHLHCWAMSDGSGVVIGQPDYLQEPLFKIVNDGSSDSNVISGRVEIDFARQPSVIIAKGFQGGGDFATTRIRTAKINEFIGYNPPFTANAFKPYPKVAAEIAQFKGLVPLPFNKSLIADYATFFTPPPVPRVFFWEDESSREVHQLEGAVNRKMSEFQRNAMRLHYTVQDHVQNGLVWKHNTIVLVTDQAAGIVNKPFWIISVSFKRSRSRGTTTDLVLIPVGTLQFGPF